MAETAGESKHIKTNDGVNLHYLESGSGPPLVMIPGWSQSAAQFKYQLEGLNKRYRCIAIDMRGHGESEKVEFGYRIQRLAKDVQEVLADLNLKDVTLLGHSMGCSVIWCYWDLFGADRVAKLILVDEPPFLTVNPAWSETEREAAGAAFDLKTVLNTYNTLIGPNGKTTTAALVSNMLTSAIAPEEKAWIIEQNLRLPRQYAAALMYNHCAQDWRDVIPRINVPTLIIGGKVSVVPWKSQVWIHEQIPNSELVLFEESEGGQHFMFIEGAAKFNEVVAAFLG